jgi:hypothetical protein
MEVAHDKAERTAYLDQSLLCLRAGGVGIEVVGFVYALDLQI